MSLCKLFCLHFVTQHARFLSGMFIVSWLELQKQQLKEGVNHSFQSGWVQRFTKWFGGWNGAMLWHNALVHSHELGTARRRSLTERLAKYLFLVMCHGKDWPGSWEDRTGDIYESLQESPSRYVHIYSVVSGAIWAITPVGAEGDKDTAWGERDRSDKE